MSGEKLISILIPAYNEEIHLEALLERALAGPLPDGYRREIVLVDDGSTDETAEIAANWAAAHPDVIRMYRLEVNRGKGAALRLAISKAAGSICLIQDADLEYDPADYKRMLKPLVEQKADAVFGSRFGFSEERRVLLYWHTVANHRLTGLCNMVSDLNLTDIMTGYKAFRTSLMRTIPLRCDGFGIEPEMTVKLAQRGARIYEVPVSYHGRGYAEGKKIRLRDALRTPFTILWYGLRRDVYLNPGARILDVLAATPRFNEWMASVVAPHLGKRVLEIGAGIGNLSALLSRGRKEYLATDLDAEHVERLEVRFASNPRIGVMRLDAACAEGFEAIAGRVDSVVCLNVLEHVEDDRAGFRNLYNVLEAGGLAVVLVPQDAGLYGTLDRVLGHCRRYSRPDLESRMREAGFELERVFEFNRVTRPGWFVNGRVLKRTSFGRLQLAVFDRLVWLWKRLEGVLPWGGVSLIAVGRKPS
jgi:glycosyltransferase involved in cell wall biosynthesis